MNKCIIIFTTFIFNIQLYVSLMEREDGIIILNDRNFEIEISKYDIFVVEFYSPDCNHCKNFSPEYIKLAKRLLKSRTPILTGKIDAETNKSLALKFNIKHVPQVYILNKKYKPILYTGALNAEDLFAFIEFQVAKTNEDLTANQIDDLFLSQDQGFIFLGENKEKFKIYDFRAKTYFDGNFAYCPSKECLKRFDAKDGDIVMFKYKGAKLIKFDKELNIENLDTFIVQNSLDVVEDSGDSINMLIFNKKLPGVYLFTESEFESDFYVEMKRMMFKVLKKMKVSKHYYHLINNN